MSQTNSAPDSVRALVAQADQRRRARAADARVQTLAPWLAGLALAAGISGRLLSGAIWIGPAALAAGIAILAVVAWIGRRPRPTTDAVAVAVDDDARLQGELRSAHWFEQQADRDAWVDFHLGRAATHARAVAWASLYPSVWSRKPLVAAGLMVVGVMAVTVRLPERSSSTTAAGLAAGDLGAALPADLQDKLARLMAQLDDAALNPDAKALSLAELKTLMANLTPDARQQLAAALERKALGAEPKAGKDAGAKAPSAAQTPPASADLPEDVKWALENMAAHAAQTDERKPAAGDPAAPAQAGEAGTGALQPQTEAGAKPDAQAPIMREAASDDASKKMLGGGGPMGGDAQPGAGKTNSNVTGAAEAVLMAQALRKELLEASGDALGNNTDKPDERKKTEQGTSSLGFTRVAAARNVDPSRAAAPPPVPEGRRSLLYTYFIRR